MGCVLSDVVTWVAEGLKKLQEYRRRRILEVKNKSSVSEDLFHFDWKRLDTVNEIHDEIMQNRRQNDHITPEIVQRLIKAMIVPDYRERASAQFIVGQSSNILEETREKLGLALRKRNTVPSISHTVSDGVIESRKPKLPPVLPPGHSNRLSDSSFRNETWGPNEELTPAVLNHSSTPFQRRIVRNGLSPGSAHDNMRNLWLHRVSRETQLEDDPEDRYQPQLTRSGQTERILSPLIHRSSPGQQIDRHFTNQDRRQEPSLQDNLLGIGVDVYREITPPDSPSRRWLGPEGPATQKPITTTLLHNAQSAIPSPRHSETYIQNEVTSPGLQPMTPAPVANHHDATQSSFLPRPKRNNRPRPQMSLDDGLWIKRELDIGRYARYPGEDEIRTTDSVLRQRDHVRSHLSTTQHALQTPQLGKLIMIAGFSCG